MKKSLILIMALLAATSALAKPGDIPGGVIPLEGALTIEIGDLPPLKGGYTVHCKLINNNEHRKLYARVLNEDQHDVLDVRHGVNVFYFGMEGNNQARLEFQDYSQPGGNFEPITVSSCRKHSYPAN